MSDVLLSLGSNLAKKRLNLQRAVNGLATVMTISSISPVYETEPWGVTDQPSFLNICLAGYSDETPLSLLKFIKKLEREIGRQETRHWGPRLIDIDILFWGDKTIETKELTIPHPQISERSFVLAPLADIMPEFVHPLSGLTVAEMLMAVGKNGVTRLAEPLFLPGEAGE